MITESFNKTITISKQSGTVISFLTENKFVDKNIDLNISAQTATPSFDGGELTDKSASATFSNMTVSSTDTSGVVIQTKGQAGRAAVLYDGAVSGWVDVYDDTAASPAVASSEWNGSVYYATGVTLGNGKSFDITVPNGESGTVTFHFSVDASGNTTVT